MVYRLPNRGLSLPSSPVDGVLYLHHFDASLDGKLSGDYGNLLMTVTRETQAVHAPLSLVPLLSLLGVGLGVGGIATAAQLDYQLSRTSPTNRRHNNPNPLTPKSINSLAVVTPQNCHALDVLTAERGGTCAMLVKNAATL